jgi:hypothetical protein
MKIIESFLIAVTIAAISGCATLENIGNSFSSEPFSFLNESTVVSRLGTPTSTFVTTGDGEKTLAWTKPGVPYGIPSCTVSYKINSTGGVIGYSDRGC